MVDNQQDAALALIWLFPAISTVLVALRIWSRYLGRNFGWDDSVIIFAWVFAIIETVAYHERTVYLWIGYHEWDVPDLPIEEQITGLKWSYILQIGYHIEIGAIRASIVLFLFRFGDMRWYIRYSLHTVFWINVAYIIGTSIATALSCWPPRYMYDQPIMDYVVDGEVVPGGKCFDRLVFVLTSCALSIFMDLIIIPIPTAMVWNLSMPRKTKVAVVIVMSMGWIATAVSAGRFVVYYYRMQPDFKDRNYHIADTISVAEPNVALWAACVPALKRLVSRWMPYWFGSSYGNRNSYYTVSEYARTGNRPSKTPRQSRRSSTNLSRKRQQWDEDDYHMQDLNPDSDSQVHIIRQPHDAAREYGFKVGVRAEPSSSPGSPSFGSRGWRSRSS